MSDEARQARIIAIVNQKGGVGKTTTTINLGAALAQMGRKVLLIDLDPQGNASTGLGVDRDARGATSYELLSGEQSAKKIAQKTSQKKLHIIPANMDLSSADIDLADNHSRSFLLKNSLKDLKDYDFVLIDCPPSLSILTINAMVAAHGVIVPLQSEFFALEGLSQLMLTLRDVRKSANPGLRTDGILLTLHDSRNRLAKQVEADARENLGDLVFQTVVPRNVRVSEAPSYAMSILDYDPESAGGRAYRALAEELLSRLD